MSEKSSMPEPDEGGTRRDRPDSGPDAGADSGREAGPDQTAPHVPLDDATTPYGPLDDATSPYEPIDDPEATGPLTRPDQTPRGGAAAGAAADGAAAAAHRDTEATQIVNAWTGRAEVRGPVPPQYGDEWTDQEPGEPGRRWWMPILLGLLGVLLILAGVAAVTLLRRNTTSEPTPIPPVTPTAAHPVTASPSPPPSSPPPTTAPPTASTVLVPPTTGDSLPVARGKLEALGLVVHVSEQENPTATPGTVLTTDPPAGRTVPAGSDIIVFVAKAPPSASPEPKPSPTRPAPESKSPAAAPTKN
jgi:PASTA domain